MRRFLIVAIIIALIVSFVILFITKIGWREKIQVHAPKLISDLFSCTFCLSWWLSLLIAICFVIILGDLRLILASICATPIARYITI